MIIVIIIFLLFFQISFGKICFTAKYLFLDVAKVCLEYKKENNKFKTYMEASTIGLVRLFKDIKYEGHSICNQNFKPKEFHLYQKEKNLTVVYHYIFLPNRIYTEKTKNNKKEVKIIKIKNKNFFDPFTASYLILYELVKNKIRIFFEGEIYDLKISKKTNGRIKIIEINPKDIKAEGIIKPTGKWRIIYKDRELKEIRVRIKIGEIRLERIK